MNLAGVDVDKTSCQPANFALRKQIPAFGYMETYLKLARYLGASRAPWRQDVGRGLGRC